MIGLTLEFFATAVVMLVERLHLRASTERGSTSTFGACSLEQNVDIPVPQVVVVLVEVFTVFSQDRDQQRFAEQIFATLAISLTVKIIEVPVIRTQEKTQQLVNTHVQPVVNTVEVEKPKLIKETVTEVFTHFSQDRVQQRFADLPNFTR